MRQYQTYIQRILVTGAAGFIGSAVVRYLVAKTDALVINVDKLTYAGNLDNLLLSTIIPATVSNGWISAKRRA